MSFKNFKEKQKDDVYLAETCSRCQKPITPQSRAGSFTSFLFGANRCSCNQAEQVKLVVSKSTAASLSRPEDLGLSKSESYNSSEVPDLGDRYEVLELIGQGGMGAVWKVRDKAINKTLAIKLLRKELANDRFAVKRFEQEAQAAACLTQANLVAVYGSGTAKDNSPFLIMDYLDGESLADRLSREVYLPVPQALDIAAQICEALVHAHAKGVVHRDLKPSNIMLTKSSGGNDIVKIVDFGIAKLMPSVNEQTNNLTQAGELFGSPLYMSPEQCKGDTVDERSDIYSLGCIMYEMLTGKAAFAADNPIKTILKHLSEEHPVIDLTLPKGLEQLISNCLEKDLQNRYQTIAEVLFDIDLIQNGSVPKKREVFTSLNLLTAQSYWRRFGAAAVDTVIVILFTSCVGAIVLALAMQFGHALAVVNPSEQTSFLLRDGALERFACAGFLMWAMFGLLESLLPLCLILFAWTFYGFGSGSTLFETTDVAHVLAKTVFEYIVLVGCSLPSIFNYLYHALMESSEKRATIGQRLFGLQVTDLKGGRISFFQATLRHLSRTLGLLLIIDFLRLLVTFVAKKLQRSSTALSVFSVSLNDRISKCRVSQNQEKVEKITASQKPPLV